MYEVECKDGKNAMEVEGGRHEPRNGCYSSVRLGTLRWLRVAGLRGRYCFERNKEKQPGWGKRYVDQTSGWTTDESWFNSRYVQEIFLFYKAPRPTLGPTQLPIQWVPRALFPGIKRPMSWSWPLMSILYEDWVRLFLRFPVCLCGLCRSGFLAY